jgi:hypothetical protein
LANEQEPPGWDRLWCHVYDLPPDPVLARRMRALLTLSENGCRSPAWVEELRRLVEFLDHPVPLTDKELWSALGISPSEAKARLKLARLPRPILDRVFAGEITSQALLQRIARLTRDQQAAVVEQAVAGTTVSAVVIDRALRWQIDAGLAVPVLQASLAKAWETDAQPPRAVHASAMPPLAPGWTESPPTRIALPVAADKRHDVDQCGGGVPGEQSGAAILTDAVRLLRSLLPGLAREPRLIQARLLAEALLHELEPEAQRAHPFSIAA